MYLSKQGGNMVTLIFEFDGKIKTINISPMTHNRFRLYAYKINASLQKIAGTIYEKCGDISEELIIHHLDEVDL